MGFVDRIKKWFRGLIKGEHKVKEIRSLQPSAMEVEKVRIEYTNLSDELEQLQYRLAELENKHNKGELKKTDFDQKYRQQLIHASQIKIRLLKIKTWLLEIESPIAD